MIIVLSSNLLCGFKRTNFLKLSVYQLLLRVVLNEFHQVVTSFWYYARLKIVLLSFKSIISARRDIGPSQLFDLPSVNFIIIVVLVYLDILPNNITL